MQGTQVLTLPVHSLALGSTKAAPRWVEENRCNGGPQAPRVEREWPELSTRVRRWVGREREPRRPPAPHRSTHLGMQVLGEVASCGHKQLQLRLLRAQVQELPAESSSSSTLGLCR